MKREEGYYQIKIHGEWGIAFYDSNGHWNLAGSDVTVKDDKIQEIIVPKIHFDKDSFIQLKLKCPICGNEGLPMATNKDKPVHFICSFKDKSGETCGTEIIVRPKGAERPLVL